MSLIKIDSNIHDNVIYINNNVLKEMNNQLSKITLHFGGFQTELKVKSANSTDLEEIIIPQKLSDTIIIPDLSYDYYFQGNHLFLGPVIGYLVAPGYRKLKNATMCFENYEKIRGLIYIFTEKSIDTKNKSISGYFYHPQTKKFIKGVFPYPAAIYVRKKIKRKVYDHFKKNIGEKIFNYPNNIDKLSLWLILSKDLEINRHLPYTVIYSNPKQLLEVLKEHDAVYLKPFNKSRGRGILHFKKYKDKLVLTNEFSQKITIKKGEKELERVLHNILNKNTKYLIQQEIPFKYQENKIDFRIYIQKDHSLEWKLSGIETKVAEKGSIISNSKNRISIIPGAVALENIFSLDKEKADSIINEVVQLSIKALKLIEKNGYCIGDTAIDLIIDENLKIWLLEVQLNYTTLKKADRSEDEGRVLPQILPTPFEYAKGLAGF